MLNDASGFQKIYLATGYTDLRRGMEGLANIIRFHFHLDPYDRNTLFLFCGKRTYRIKGLLLEEDGFLLLYKRLDTGAFNWSRSKEEALAISPLFIHNDSVLSPMRLGRQGNCGQQY